MRRQSTVISAEIHIQVKCKLHDKSHIPTHMCIAVGEPDENNIIEYGVSGYITQQQLRKIYKILKTKTKENHG